MSSCDPGCFPPKWHLDHLRTHLQAAVCLEFWTVPYYMTAAYSIKNPASPAFRLIRSVFYQEMLHMQLAANVYNAYFDNFSFLPEFLQYEEIPVLNFNLDTPNPTEIYHPYTAELGPLDLARINTMCLIEYPDWATHGSPSLQEDIYQYGSIAEFYQATLVGMAELVEHLRGGQRQIDFFKNYYNHFENQTVIHDGLDGLREAQNLIWAITDQGEGQYQGDREIPLQYRNTADGVMPAWAHFRKFSSIRARLLSGRVIEDSPVYSGETNPAPGTPGYQAQQTLIDNFAVFLQELTDLINGHATADFGSLMPTIGANVLSCWRHGAVPKFYPDPKTQTDQPGT
ncbi:Ferritin-like protein [Sulfidibacter corallicola]|uniref:Ferritin-like protein n=1 Tax=Sulfidibacter corallicola TaxID=2818388 RepID=A0A8A4TKF9_SULCO|nr:ferritin-like protein [Sulfidibacter corallicola]QTD49318.1 ferritin-like protein [Sulfidibacter corallicola]